MVYIILGEGFEEAEAIIPCDLLRRAGVDVRFAGIGADVITGGHGITVQADCIAEITDLTQAEMIVLPGGLGGVASILGCEAVLQAVKTLYSGGKYIAAICAAPTIFAKLGLLDGKRATCYPGMETQMQGAVMCDHAVVRDETIITGKAAGTAFAFGLKLVETLCGTQTAEKIATGVVAR